jgi:hypothetical protein
MKDMKDQIVDQIVEVHWEDSAGWDGWEEPDDLHKEPAMIRTVGLLVDETEVGLLISSSHSSTTGRVLSPLIIPWGAVRGYWKWSL